jgi:parallel beta-helix repeat protein
VIVPEDLMRALIAFAVASFLFASTASAASYYVSTTGNDSASGAIDAPFKTIKAASRIAKPGDIVNVRGGVYYESSSLSTKGTAAARVVFRAMPGEQAILDGSNLAAGVDIMTLNGTDYVDFQGFEIRNAKKIALTLWGAHNTRVLDNQIHHAVKNGIYVGGDSTPSCTDITISGNIVHDTVSENASRAFSSGGWSAAVVVSRTDRATITGNRILNNDGEGLISLRSNYHVIQGNEISDNFSMNLYFDNSRFATVDGNLIFSGNSRYFRNGVPAAGIGIANETKDVMNPSSDNVFTNNVVVGTRWGFYYGNYESGGGLRNTRVFNNTFYGTTSAIIEIENGTHANSVIENNIFFSTISPDPKVSGAGKGVSYANNLWYGGNAGAAQGSGDVIGNPMFANAGGHSAADYKIGASSAALGRGLELAVAKDYFGAARVTPFDIGAHQRSTGVLDSVAPSVPANLRTAGGISDAVTLAWDPSTDNVGVTGYIVQRNGVTVATVATATWTDLAMTAETRHAYQVAALDAAGNRSSFGPTLELSWTSAESDTEAPASPVLSGMTSTPASVTLSWNRPSDNVGATQYRVYRNGMLAGSTTKLAYVDTGLATGTTYSYYVVAFDAASNSSARSNVVKLTPKVAKARTVRH